MTLVFLLMLVLLLCGVLAAAAWLAVSLVMVIATPSRPGTTVFHKAILTVVVVLIALALMQALVGLSTHVLPLTLSRML